MGPLAAEGAPTAGSRIENGLRDELGPLRAGPSFVEALHSLARSNGPSLSGYLERRGSLDELREFAVHRSAYQLKEADPHTWAIPRFTGASKSRARRDSTG